MARSEGAVSRGLTGQVLYLTALALGIFLILSVAYAFVGGVLF